MLVIPAIDLLDGAVVRLLRGDYDRVTIHDDDPRARVRRWREQGAEIVHVVDLDAARGGVRDDTTLRTLVGAGVPLQVGGGIRTPEDAVAVIGAGAARVVVGSAFTRPDGAGEDIVAAVGPDRVVAAIDVRNGRARGSGWLDDGSPLEATLARVEAAGVIRVLATGIERDGTLGGPDLDLLETIRRALPHVAIIASGGVGSLDHLASLAAAPAHVEACVVGRALYEGRFLLPEATVVARTGGGGVSAG